MGPGTGKFTDSINGSSRRQRPFLSNRANSKTHSGQFTVFDRPDSPGHHTHSFKSKKENNKAEVSALDNTDLGVKVADLSLKITELTALIMAQQGTVGEE